MKVFTFNGITNMKSRVKGDFHARLCGKVRVKLPFLTRLADSLKQNNDYEKTN